MTAPEPRCFVTDLYMSQCAHCRAPRQRWKPQVGTGTFEAKFPGTCADCLEHIEPGDRIAYTDGGYVCHVCLDCMP